MKKITERKLKRVHPGIILKGELVEYSGLTITEVADLLKMTRSNVSNLLNGKISLSTNVALRIEQVFGGSAEHLMKMQTAYDLDKERVLFNNNSVKLKKYNFKS
ncbi:MAG: HigA family addiction module antidote protein [Flavobacteriaceae bacterium]|jgi:addiction module HigA family antidote|nr:HigA family addiction module antidote protein [Flavobacteriaceae bacterium]